MTRLPADCLSGAERTRLLRLMMLARVTEQRARLFLDREAGAAPAARWRDAIGAGTAAALRPQDRLIAPGRYLAAHVGRRLGSIGGRSAAADLVPMAVGAALAIAERGSDGVVVTLLDEGALASERWTESLDLATARRLPLVLVVEVADATTGASPSSTPGPPPPRLGEPVDGGDPEAVLVAVRAAVERARGGAGPAILACVAPPAASAARGARDLEAAIHDPIELYARRLFGAGVPRREIDAALQGVEEEAVA